MDDTSLLKLGKNRAGDWVYLYPALANRHGLITGATGTGKTVSLQVLAERFSRLGVPVFTADVKGDLSGLAKSATVSPKLQKRIDLLALEDYSPQACPVLFWDLYGKNGHAVRTTVSEIGPLLLSHMLDLNETQSGVLQICFRVADEQGLLLLDLKDLRAMLQWLSENRREVSASYGNVAPTSVAAIQRRLLVLEDAGGDVFLGEPALQLPHLMQTDFSGKGVVSILDATQLINNPRLYSAFLLWLLSELFEQLEERGDAPLPRLVFFFDEAHLLFKSASKPLLEKVEQVVRLVRSKGVGIFFVTQHPADIPDAVLGQLGNKLMHSLRAYTPKEQKAVKTAAASFRANPNFDTQERITNLGVGESLISVLDEKGRPTVVEETVMLPPDSNIGKISAESKQEVFGRSPLKGVYDKALDRVSAFEELQKRAKAEAKEPEQKKSKRQGVGETFLKSIIRTIGTTIGRQIARGVLGSVIRGR